MQFLRMGIFVLFCGLSANSLLAQNFDERMSDWPLDLKINGTILASGGGDPDEYMRDGFWQLAGGEKAKIVEIVYDDSNVHGEEESEEKQDTDDPLKSGASYSMFCWADKSDVKIRDQLTGATGVWLQADDKLNRNQRKQIRALVDNLGSQQRIRRSLDAPRPVQDPRYNRGADGDPDGDQHRAGQLGQNKRILEHARVSRFTFSPWRWRYILWAARNQQPSAMISRIAAQA